LWKLVYFIVFVPVAMVIRAIRPPLEQGWRLDIPSYFSPPAAALARQPGQLR
jgi:hypothetical protein